MPIHAIQLGNAWERQPGEAHAVADAWRRRFGRPTGLAPGDRVVVVVERPAIASSPMLNGCGLAPIAAGAGRWSCDVTSLLRLRNELVITAGVSPGAVTTRSLTAPPGEARGPLPAALGGVRLVIVPRGEVWDAPLPPGAPTPPRLTPDGGSR